MAAVYYALNAHHSLYRQDAQAVRALAAARPMRNVTLRGDFTPVLTKHTKSFKLVDTLSMGGGRTRTQRPDSP